MIQKVNITSVFINPEQEMKGRDGRAFKSCRTAIKTKEHGDKWVSGFASKERAEELKEKAKGLNGYEIDLEISQSEKLDKNGQPYINWKFPSKEDSSRSELNKVSFRVDKHDFQIKELQDTVRKMIKGEKVEMPKSDYPKLEKMPDFGEGDDGNIPF